MRKCPLDELIQPFRLPAGNGSAVEDNVAAGGEEREFEGVQYASFCHQTQFETSVKVSSRQAL